MKGFFLAVLLALPLALVAGEVKLGDNSEVVRSALGSPRGRTQVGAREIFYYDRGEVELNSGTVTRVALRSVDEQLALDTKREADAQRFREEQETHFARMTADGEALKARKLHDPVFLATPAAYQAAFWQDFSRHYTEVPCAEQLQVAHARLAETQAQTQQLADLEARVADAEAQLASTHSPDYSDGYYPYGYGYTSYGHSHSGYYSGLNHFHNGGGHGDHGSHVVCANLPGTRAAVVNYHSPAVVHTSTLPWMTWDGTRMAGGPPLGIHPVSH
jgi:hypothetical protein